MPQHLIDGISLRSAIQIAAMYVGLRGREADEREIAASARGLRGGQADERENCVCACVLYLCAMPVRSGRR